MTVITIVLDDKKDEDGRYKNQQVIISHSKEALKMGFEDAVGIAHDITQGTYHKVTLNKFRDDK